MRHGANQGTRPERIPIVMVVRERAKRKELPEIVMPQLELSTAFEIPGQKAKSLPGLARQIFEKLSDARQHAAIASRQFLGQQRDITIKERIDILLCDWLRVFLENLPGDPSIRASGNLHAV